MDMVSPAETHFPGVHKIDAPISGPRIGDKKFYGHEDFSDSYLRDLWGYRVLK